MLHGHVLDSALRRQISLPEALLVLPAVGDLDCAAAGFLVCARGAIIREELSLRGVTSVFADLICASLDSNGVIVV